MFGIGKLAKPGQAGNGLTVPKRVAALLKRLNATLHLPGAYGEIVSGFNTGNFTESTGQTYASIDGKVGLVTDAAGSLGENIAPALEAANWLVSGTDATHVVTWQAGGGFRYQSDATSPVLMVSKSGILTPGKTYELVLNCSSYVSGSLKIDATTIGAIQLASSAGISRCVFTATASTLTLYRNTTNVDLTVSSLSIRELTGTHALQATDGYKPVERRGLVNLLTYSNDFSNAAWSKGSGIVPSVTGDAPWGNETTMTSAGGTPALTQTRVGGNATTMTYAFLVKRAGTRTTTSFALRNDTTATVLAVINFTVSTCLFSVSTGSPVVDSLNIQGTNWYLGCITVSSGITATDTLRVYAGSLGQPSVAGETYVIGPSALFQGTVTAQQILDAGGIPVTTDAPKSSSLGPRYWQFDGVDDRLQLSNSVIQPQDDFAIIAAIKPTLVDSTAKRVFSSSGTTSAVELYVGSNTGYPILRVKDDSAVDTFTSGVTSLLRVKSVVSARKTGNSKTIRVNGVQVTENTAATGSGTNTSAYIGTTSTGFGAFQGEKYLLILVKGAITDAELLLLEKFAGKLAGVQI